MAFINPDMPFVIAEISCNHLGSLDRARELVVAAKSAGADAVKFQHYTPDSITANSTRPEFVLGPESPWSGQTLWQLYSEAMTPWSWTEELSGLAAGLGLNWFSTPFDETAISFLEGFSPAMYKISSFEIVDLPLVRCAAQTGKPLVLSTGMATISEIDAAVSEAESAGAEDITILRTNSGYPAAFSEMDLLAIPEMVARWGWPVGLSDHTLGNSAALVAVGLGARVFEKHLTLSRKDGGPDSAFSAEPEELAEYVSRIREAHSCLGEARFGPSEKEIESISLRPSLRAFVTIESGQTLGPQNFRSLRPAGGLPPEQATAVEGKVASRRIEAGEAITWSVLR